MKTALLSLFIVTILNSCTLSDKSTSEKPNIIFVMLDDFGYSQIAYNSQEISEKDYDPLFLEYTLENGDYSPVQALDFSRRATPTLSRMAKQGVIFTNAFTSSNLCAPSRIGIATGIQQNRWGIYRNIDCEAHGPKPGSLLAIRLQKSGYATAHIGKWHIGRRDQNMVAEFMKKHGRKDSAGIYPSLWKHPKIRKDLNENGYMGSCIPEHNPINNGFDYYYGYNTWESPFYNATNIWNGFEHVPPNPNYNTDVFTQEAISFIEKSIENKKPFYVQLHYHAVHAPLQPKAPEEYYSRFNSESFILNNFYAHVFAVDENIQKLEKFLMGKGIAENTIIVFTSDNGGSIGKRSTLPGNAPFRGHKGMHLMGGIKVPLFFYWPAGIQKPAVNHLLVSTLDILPTVLDASGIVPPQNIDGKSLLSYLKGNSEKPVHEYLFWSGIHGRTWGFMSQHNNFAEVRSRDQAPYAWVVVKDNYALRFISETKPGLYKDLPDGKPAFLELYNIGNDPGEKMNVKENEPERLEELKSIWEKEAIKLPPPVKIGRHFWEEIVPENNIYKNQ